MKEVSETPRLFFSLTDSYFKNLGAKAKHSSWQIHNVVQEKYSNFYIFILKLVLNPLQKAKNNAEGKSLLNFFSSVYWMSHYKKRKVFCWILQQGFGQQC